MLLQFIENILNESTGRHGKIITSSFHSKPYWNAKLSELSKQLRIDRKNFSYRNTDSNKVKFLQRCIRSRKENSMSRIYYGKNQEPQCSRSP